MKLARFNNDQAVVLQVIEEAGEEDIESLVETLRFDRHRLISTLQSLHRNGFIHLKTTSYGTIAELSSKGRKTAQLLWPELPYINYR